MKAFITILVIGVTVLALLLIRSEVILALLEKEGVKNIMFCATDLARYGDMIQIYAALKKSPYVLNSFPTFSEPIATRRPLFGRFQLHYGHLWLDEENGVEFY